MDQEALPNDEETSQSMFDDVQIKNSAESQHNNGNGSENSDEVKTVIFL